jgi:hypothetical protein
MSHESYYKIKISFWHQIFKLWQVSKIALEGGRQPYFHLNSFSMSHSRLFEFFEITRGARNVKVQLIWGLHVKNLDVEKRYSSLKIEHLRFACHVRYQKIQISGRWMNEIRRMNWDQIMPVCLQCKFLTCPSLKNLLQNKMFFLQCIWLMSIYFCHILVSDASSYIRKNFLFNSKRKRDTIDNLKIQTFAYIWKSLLIPIRC